jgi:transcriptional regulator of arginine metabolism
MKKKRLELIMRLIEKYPILTQEELLNRLRESGFDVTQATVSRDINELRLVKMIGANGQYRYVANRTDSDELVEKFNAIFTQSVISCDYAGNTIVIRCHTGMAQAACAAFDSMHWDGLVGTLAGDDTIFALCRTEGYASQMRDAIQRLLGK